MSFRRPPARWKPSHFYALSGGTFPRSLESHRATLAPAADAWDVALSPPEGFRLKPGCTVEVCGLDASLGLGGLAAAVIAAAWGVRRGPVVPFEVEARPGEALPRLGSGRGAREALLALLPGQKLAQSGGAGGSALSPFGGARRRGLLRFRCRWHKRSRSGGRLPAPRGGLGPPRGCRSG